MPVLLKTPGAHLRGSAGWSLVSEHCPSKSCLRNIWWKWLKKNSLHRLCARTVHFLHAPSKKTCFVISVKSYLQHFIDLTMYSMKKSACFRSYLLLLFSFLSFKSSDTSTTKHCTSDFWERVYNSVAPCVCSASLKDHYEVKCLYE